MTLTLPRNVGAALLSSFRQLTPSRISGALAAPVWQLKLLALLLIGGFCLTQTNASAEADWNWEWRNPLPHGNSLFAVVRGEDKYVAVGSGGRIVVSENGTTFETFDTQHPEELRSIAWNGTLYVAVGRFGTILTSPDLFTWSVVDTDTTEDLYGVAWNGSTFVAVGANGTFLGVPISRNCRT